jgi:phenylalanyl-tRNA synthetase alpha chain
METTLREAQDDLSSLRDEATREIGSAETTGDVEHLRVTFTGKRSRLSGVMRAMAVLDPEARKELGSAANATKRLIEDLLARREGELARREIEEQLAREKVDVTLPGTPYTLGYRHPVLETAREILEILAQMGFDIYESRQVELDLYNFELLNMPKHHPSRDLWDTFYVSEDVVLRTHTSPAQIHYMQSHEPPIRVAVPGWCYREEREDATHGNRFYQIEGLAVDTDISLADLKGTLTELAKRLLGEDRRVRFRPHYFPFTEPSAELDVDCAVCGGEGCASCDYHGWLELLGGGVVHPLVLENSGHDPEKVSGFAFGLGVDRFTMMRYGITDLRMFRENDLRFLKQFN